jgi:Ni/Fe-hydrogenase subunit HybB-like protein
MKDFNIAPWRKKMYKILALGYNGTPAQKKYLHQAHDIMAAIIIPTAVIAYSLLSLLFSMSLKPGWHSTIFSPYFVVTAGYSGLALLIVIMWIYRKTSNVGKYITNLHFNYFAFGLILLTFIYAYFSFSEYLTQWYNQTNSFEALLNNMQDLDQFGWLSLFHVIFAFVVPIIVLGFPWLRTINSVTFVSVFIVLALWVKRYLIVVPPLENPFIPIQDIRPEYVNYSASWVEWALTASGIAIIILIFVVASKLAPIIPVSEVADAENIEKPKLLFKTKGE